MHHGGSTKACGCRMIERNHDQLQVSWLWPADRLGCNPAIRATSHHVGRVAVISADGHARRSHHRMKCTAQSVGHEWFDALGNAYMGNAGW